MRPYYDEAGITVYHGDALEVLPELPEIGALVTDPPYSSGGLYRGDRVQRTVTKYTNSDTWRKPPEFSGDNRDQRSFLAWASLWLTAARNLAAPGAMAIIFTDWRQLPTVTDAVQCGGWLWRGLATWWKPGIRMQRGCFSASSEFLVWGTNGQKQDHDGAPQNVFACQPVGGEEREHAAEKPLEVMTWALKAVPRDAVIVDPFMGSGTTLRAAKDLGRRAVGIELEERFCEVAARRLAQGVLPLALPGEAGRHE